MHNMHNDIYYYNLNPDEIKYFKEINWFEIKQ